MLVIVSCGLPPSAGPSGDGPVADTPTDENASEAPSASPPWRPLLSAVCPPIEANSTSLRFGPAPALDCPRRNTCRPHNKLVGASAEEIYGFIGTPFACEGNRWTYRLNGSCDVEHDILTLELLNGEVIRAEHEHRFAGPDCPSQAPRG